MSHASTGWPAPGPRLRLEAMPSFFVLFVDMASHAKCSGRCKNDRPLRNGTCRSVEGAAATPPTGGATAVAAVAAGSDGETRVVCIDVVCPYTRELVVEGLARRRGAWRVTTDSAEATLHWGDYEMIDWERVVSGELTFDTVLLLRAAKEYPVDRGGIVGARGAGGAGGGGGGAFVDEDPLAHITNTARQAEDETFREEDERFAESLPSSPHSPGASSTSAWTSWWTRTSRCGCSRPTRDPTSSRRVRGWSTSSATSSRARCEYA
ncbi:unnamed protein product [Pylaiella littoralis]